MQITINRTFDVNDDLLNEIACDIITAAVEGGINYWASVKEYRWGDPSIGHSHDQANGNKDWQPDDRQYVTVKVHDDEENVWHFVNADKMIEAIKKVVNGDVKPFYNMGYRQTFADRLIAVFANGNTDDYDFDADDADSMMQVACLGSVVYG